MIEVRTQAQLDKALKKTNEGRDELIVCLGDGSFVLGDSATVRAGGSATVEARGSATVEAWDSATVEARGSATVRAGGSATVRAGGSATVEAWDSATVRAGGSATVRARDSATVEAWDSATVEAGGSATVRAGGSATVEAWDSATVEARDSATVEAWDSATVRAGGSATVRAGGSATVRAAKHTPVIKSDRAKDVKITGGVVIEIPTPTTAEEWCDFHNVEVRKGGKFSRKLAGQDVATLFKALDDDFRSGYGFAYIPGTAPEAPDWDGGKQECGGGLHFSPTPWQAKEFAPGATRFVACPVLVADITVHPDGSYPQKVKAPRLCAPCWEVDIDGEPVAENNESEEEE